MDDTVFPYLHSVRIATSSRRVGGLAPADDIEYIPRLHRRYTHWLPITLFVVNLHIPNDVAIFIRPFLFHSFVHAFPAGFVEFQCAGPTIQHPGDGESFGDDGGHGYGTAWPRW